MLSQFWISEPLGGEEEENDKKEERLEKDGSLPTDVAGYEDYDPIDIVVRLRDLRRRAGANEKSQEAVTLQAIQILQNKAESFRKQIHEPQIKKRFSSHTVQENPAAELDWESTIETFAESGSGKLESDHYEWTLDTPKDSKLLLVMDLSLSMKGEKLAMLTTAVASLALSLPQNRFAVLGFDSTPIWMKKFSESLTDQELIGRILTYPASGFTHIEEALTFARDSIPVSHRNKTQVLLLTDGTYTEGGSPLPLASQFYKLNTLSVGKNIGGRTLLVSLASQGNGEYFEARDLHSLPSVLLKTMRSLLR
ncbi:MAG: VWA domain-containing protein [Xanthomonadaceae bacterium]|nr:VWA domain-containing protein [Xanthomonadaceae bacterium]